MSLSGRIVQHYTILSAKAATGIGNTINVRDFRNAVVKVGSSGTTTATIKFQGAVASPANDYLMPDFAAAQTVANNWDYVQAVDLNSGTAISGDTGIAFTGADDFRLFEININGLDYINIVVTAFTQGAITAVVQCSTNL